MTSGNPLLGIFSTSCTQVEFLLMTCRSFIAKDLDSRRNRALHQSYSLQNRNQKHWAKNFGHGNERVCLKPKLLPPKVLLMASIITPWLLQSQVRTISMTISITDLIASHMHITRFYLSAKEIWETVRRLVQAEAFLPKLSRQCLIYNT